MRFAYLLSAFGLLTSLYAQTIAEKKESFYSCENEMDQTKLQQLRYLNEELEEKHYELTQLYKKAHSLFEQGAEETAYEPLLHQIRALKQQISEVQKIWKNEISLLGHPEEYALWHQPETCLQQLVTDYGGTECIYLIPPEIGSIPLALHSNLPVPRESWEECLSLILSHHGVGIREIGPFIQELYLLTSDEAQIEAIVAKSDQLDLYPDAKRICFVHTPKGIDPRSDMIFLEKFYNPTTTDLEIIGGKIYITGPAGATRELLKLHGFAKQGGGEEDFQLVTLSKLDANEVLTLLANAAYEKTSLRAIVLQNLPQSLFLMGSMEEVKKAKKLIEEIESQVENPLEKRVFWYTAKHSEADELASVLAKVYDVLTDGSAQDRGERPKLEKNATKGKNQVVPAIEVKPGAHKAKHKTADGENNFIVDPKTGSIIMVVHREAIPQIQALLKKLDVPKKMVQLEVLLFEKKISNQSKFGLNLLRLGSTAGGDHSKSMNWEGGKGGILDFLLSKGGGSVIPAYDLAYQFMLGHDNIQINASPSVTTINQTPATIAIVDEISIDSGANEKKERIYTRTQYGITLQITPTINSDDEGDFVTLDTDITFDTPKKNVNSRPDVTRRHIKNHVRIADGETVILGGLRRKTTQDHQESIPFLGEIPGIGKLFGHTETDESSSEMFVFITPTIIADPIEDAKKLRREVLVKRPGDIPEYLQELGSAKLQKKRRLFEGTLTALFGREEIEEYDGR